MITVVKGYETELIEKKSRFLGLAAHVESEEEVNEILAGIRKKYWDASHHCYAFTIGETLPQMRCTDDGEPSGTAGKPMLQVLTGMELCNTLVVVTRYFGGTLLGTGGLVRAYSGAAKEALEAADKVERIPGIRAIWRMAYTELGKVQYILAQNELTPEDVIYTDQVEVIVQIPEGDYPGIEKKLVEGTNARISLIEKEKYCILKKV